MKLISYIDDRHSTEEGDHSDNQIAKLFWYHISIYGPNSCIVEDCGVEVDPIDELGLTEASIEKAIKRYDAGQEHKKKMEEFWKARIKLNI